MQSIAAQTHNLRYANMGLVRYILAFAVMISHFCTFFSLENWFPISSYHAVGGFFGLSGFLVYASYQKHPDLKHYIAKRAARILPAYSFIVILCAVSLCLLSSLPIGQYFSSGQFWKYLIANLTCLNFIEPNLPGVFVDNVTPAVNGSLWTIKIEWCLYLSVPIVAWLLKKTKWRLDIMAVCIYLASMVYRIIFYQLYESTGSEIYGILGRQFLGQLMYFYWGVVLFIYKDKLLKHKWSVIAACIAGLVINHYIFYASFLLEPMIVTTLTILASIAITNIRFLNGSNNLSYDMYLYHFPIGQALWVLLGGKADVAVIFIIYCVLTVLLAALSWFGIGVRFARHNSKA